LYSKRRKADLYAQHSIEKSGVITLFFTPSCNLFPVFQFWSSLGFSCVVPACVHATPSHSLHGHPPCKSRICHGGLGISNHFKLGNEVTPTPTSPGVQIMTAGLAFTASHADMRVKDMLRRVKKRRFGNFKGRKTSFHFPVKCVHMIATSSPLPSPNLRPCITLAPRFCFCPTHEFTFTGYLGCFDRDQVMMTQDTETSCSFTALVLRKASGGQA
jgi:hypothetical protein